MKIKKIGRVKKNMILKHKESKNLYIVVWDNLRRSWIALNIIDKSTTKPSLLDFDIEGELGINYTKVDGIYKKIENEEVCENDVYEITNDKGKIVDVILISKIKNDRWDMIHKDGSVDYCYEPETILLGLQHYDKKYLGIHYEIVR